MDSLVPVQGMAACKDIRCYSLHSDSDYRLEKSLFPHGSSASCMAICSQFTVGLFFRIASLKTPKVCGGMAKNADIRARAETSSDTLTLAVHKAGAKSLQTGKIPASPWSCSRVWAWLQRLTVAASSACRDAAYTDLCYVLTKIISFFKHKKVIAKITTFIPKAGLPDTRRVSLR